MAILAAATALSWIAPAWTFHLALLEAAAAGACLIRARGERLPLRLPKEAARDDPGAPKPDRQGFWPASGIAFVGNEAEGGREMWLGQKDLLAHALVLGTTGSGKTQALVSLAHVRQITRSNPVKSLG
jgi:hypothetical protein